MIRSLGSLINALLTSLGEIFQRKGAKSAKAAKESKKRVKAACWVLSSYLRAPRSGRGHCSALDVFWFQLVRRGYEVHLVIALLVPGGVWAGEATLLHDPFQRPEPPKINAKSPELPASPAASAPDWQPELRAVMQAENRSMVNVSGFIVLVGQELEGYRLVEVQERSAVFLKNGAKMVLSLDRKKQR
jgi:hypothetical protein